MAGVSARTRTRWRHRVTGSLRSVGPELISAASDNDPTNVGTAAVVGAQTAYQLAWVALLVAPLLGVVQTIAAHVGSVAHNDIQTLTIKRYGQSVAAVLLVSVVVVNVVTIAADLQAGAAGIGILLGINSPWLVLALGLALVGLLLVGKYDEVVAVLRYLLIGFLVFGVAAVLGAPRLVQGPQVQPCPHAFFASRRGRGWPRHARHDADELCLCVGDHRARTRRSARG